MTKNMEQLRTEIDGEVKEYKNKRTNTELNPMCKNCINGECRGTTNKVWSGCVYRITKGSCFE